MLAELARYFAAQPALAGSGDKGMAAGSDTSDDEPASDFPAFATDGVKTLVSPIETQQDAAGVLENGGDVGGSEVSVAARPASSRDRLLEIGRRIALEGIASRKLPACRSCHGVADRSLNPYYPYLTGQPEWYLSEHLQLWKKGTRGGTPYSRIMAEIAEKMTKEQIRAVSAWYATQVGK